MIVAEAEKLHLPYKIIVKNKNRPNIFVGENFSKKEGVLFVAHTDTVPAGDESQWTHPPFAAEVEAGKLYGRGAMDCKAGIAVSLYALKKLQEMGHGPAAKFVAVADEESGADSDLGLKYVLEQGLQAQGAVYTYGGGQNDELIIGHRGLLRLWVTAKGEAYHTGTIKQDAASQQNAVNNLLGFLQQIKDWQKKAHNPYFPGYDSRLNITLLTGGTAESMVPAQAQALLDIRLLPEHSPALVLKEIKNLLAKYNQNLTNLLELTVKNKISGVLSSPKSAIVQQAIAVKKDWYGVQPQLRGSGPANESYMLIEKGTPTITGCGIKGTNYHAVDEYVEVESLEKSIRFLSELALQL